MSLPPHVKIPKTPRPERACLVANAVALGLRECVSVTRQDLDALRGAQRDFQQSLSHGRVYEVKKQIKAAGRYLKRIEYQLTKLEDLQDLYILNQKLRDGVRTMAYAYALSPGKDRVAALSNVRSGFRECTETLCTLEVQLEQLIGTLSLEMNGIQGFARLCPGDVFEVTIKHGPQKWRTRGKVGKDNSQTWDKPMAVFKGLLGEMLVIKAVEVKLLGKTVAIGRKICETRELFSPHPQLMTINLNPSGSLKLNIVITWDPLDGLIEDGPASSLARTPSITSSSPRARKRPIFHSLSSSPPIGASLIKEVESSCTECDHDSSFGSMSARSSTADSASPLSEYRSLLSSHNPFSNRTDTSSPISEFSEPPEQTDSQDSVIFNNSQESTSPSCDNTGNFTLVRKKESRVEQWAKYSKFTTPQSSDLMTRSFPHLPTSSECSLDNVIARSLSQHLDSIASDISPLKWNEGHAWDPSSIPNTLPKIVSRLRTCLEDIQGQFPELHSLEEAVLVLSDLCRGCRSRHDSNTSEISLSVESALECFDFLNAECEDDFADDNPEECAVKNAQEARSRIERLSLEPAAPMVTGSSQLDYFLLIHLKHSLILLQHLGAFGPLKGREQRSVDQLRKEGSLLENVVSHRHNFDNLKPQHILTIPHVQVLWDSVSSGDSWCTDGRSVVKGLLSVVTSLVENHNPQLAMEVLQELVIEMSDAQEYSENVTVTAGHFLQYLHDPLQEIIPEITKSLHIAGLLGSPDTEKVQQGLELISRPTSMHINLMGKIFSEHLSKRPANATFIDRLSADPHLLQLVSEKCYLQLESLKTCERESACILLGSLAPLLCKEDAHGSSDGSARDQSILGLTASQKDSTLPKPIEVLSFLQQNDPCRNVREAARCSLLGLGSQGKTALEQIQLSTNGFQGVDVKEKTKV